MQAIKRLFGFVPYLIGFIFALAVLIVGIAFLLPGEKQVENSTTIKAPIEFVLPYLNDLHNFNRWHPRATRNPDTRYAYTGADVGEGSTMIMTSPDPSVATASQTITKATDNRIEIRVDSTSTQNLFFDISPNGENTALTWGHVEVFGNNLRARLGSGKIDGIVNAEQSEGLSNLKSLIEVEYEAHLEKEREKALEEQLAESENTEGEVSDDSSEIETETETLADGN